jgi:20S proteasome alpha/beta subunit
MQYGHQLQRRCDTGYVPPVLCALWSVANGFVGADSRTTTGAYIANRVTDKLTQVHDTIWCCRSGSAADTQAVADIVHYQLGMYGVQNGRPPTTQVAAAMFQELCYDNKDRLRSVYPTSTVLSKANKIIVRA